MNNYVCKIATIEEMNRKWNYEINKATEDKNNWIIWKHAAINAFRNGKIIPYYGLLDGEIICECTAALDSTVIQNSTGLVDDKTAYLFAFRTNKEYQDQGYFSQLFKFMINDLISRGYEKVTLGVEPHEEKNKAIYTKYGFIEYIKNAKEVLPDGTSIDVEYYGRTL